MGVLEFLFKKQIKKQAHQTASVNISKYQNKIKAAYQNNNNFNISNGSKWPGGISYNNFTLDHYSIRQNVRSSVQDSPIAKAIVERYADTIADIGLRLEPTPDLSLIFLKDSETWINNVKTRFHLWANSKDQHRAGLYNFYQAQRMYAGFQQRDNDIFMRFFYSNRKDLINPLQFEFIDPNQIRGNAYTNSIYQYQYDDGIERYPDGSEKKYKVWLQNPDMTFKDVDILKWGIKSGKLQMLHGFYADYAGQTRGYSRLSHAIQDFQNITDFSESYIKKAIAQSSIVMGVENKNLDPSNPFLDNITRGAGPSIVDTGTGFEIDTQNNLNRVSFSNIPEATLRVPGSVGVFNLQKADTLKMYENKTPAESYESFLNAFISFLCSSVGMSLEVLLMKFNNNYSASRATLLLFWRIAQIWREEMAADFLNPIFQTWLSLEIGLGRISAPGWQDAVLKAAWSSCNWIGSSVPNIDPKNTAAATKLNLEMGLTTRDRESINLNGSNGTANRRKLKQENKELNETIIKEGV